MKISVITSLYNCSKYLKGYLESVALISNIEGVEVLLLHNAPTTSEMDILNSELPAMHQNVKHIVIPEREGLYKTWNRGIEMATGEYIAIWNVDDVRTPDSLKQQAEMLDNNIQVALVYGEYIGVRTYGERQGVHYKLPEFDSWKFSRSCFLSPFPMWRKSVHQTIGYFDEQFRSAGDYDFQLRVVRNWKFAKAPDVCGYYLEAPETGISKTGDINNIERTVCELRFGIFDKVNMLYIKPALKYHLTELIKDGNREDLSERFEGLNLFLLKRLPLLPLMLLRLPINVARFFKHKVLPQIVRYINYNSKKERIIPSL
ncbi:MAG: glycosyltransferase [Candidatus Kapaibacterium sp.]